MLLYFVFLLFCILRRIGKKKSLSSPQLHVTVSCVNLTYSSPLNFLVLTAGGEGMVLRDLVLLCRLPPS